jgi:hypothetical protein
VSTAEQPGDAPQPAPENRTAEPTPTPTPTAEGQLLNEILARHDLDRDTQLSIEEIATEIMKGVQKGSRDV